MAEHNDTGKAGEIAAVEFLRENGYRILATNWRYLHLEADIIAECGDLLIVAEVKTRKTSQFGEPEVFVNRQKQANLVKAADAYIRRYQLEHEVRFDILAVLIVDGRTQVRHLEGAFYPRLNK